MIRAAPGLYPVIEIVPPNTAAAFLVMAGPYGLAEDELEEGEAWFVDRVDTDLRPDGYRLAGTFAPGSEIAAGVVGFRRVLSNAWGDHLWVEDFITGGVGPAVETNQLLMYLESQAKRLGLTQIHIDLLPDEPPAEGPDEVKARGLAAVKSLDDLPGFDGWPLMDRKTAVLHGFREVAGRFVLKINGGEDEEVKTDQGRGASPLDRRRQLGRPRPPRRGH